MVRLYPVCIQAVELAIWYIFVVIMGTFESFYVDHLDRVRGLGRLSSF